MSEAARQVDDSTIEALADAVARNPRVQRRISEDAEQNADRVLVGVSGDELLRLLDDC